MSKFGSVKSQITIAIRRVNRALDRIDESYLQPYSSGSSLRTQRAQLLERNSGMTCAKLTIENALDNLERRYETAQRFIEEQPNGDALAVELERHWEENGGDNSQNNAQRVISLLDSQIESELSLANEISEKLADTAAANDQPLLRMSSQDSLLAEVDASARNTANPRSSSAAVRSSAQVSAPQADNFVQLRKLELPTFDGDQGQFYDFWAKFQTMVHDNPTLTSASKFLHLASCLKGNAALVVESFDITNAENYELAIKALLKRYDRPDFTHQHFLQKLEDLSPSSASASSQRDTLCRIQACVLQLNRYEDTSQSLALKNIVRKKFPMATQLEVLKMEHQSGLRWSLDQLLSGFDKFIEELEGLDDSTQFPLHPSADDSAMNTASADEDADIRPTTPLAAYDPDICCFCASSNHCSSGCHRSMTPSNRRLVVDRYQLCYKCLVLGHVAANCSASNCNRCGKAHHPLLCLRNPSRRSLSRSPARRRSVSGSRLPRDSYRSSCGHHSSRNSSRESYHHRSSTSRDYSRSPVRRRSRDRDSHRSTRYSSPYSHRYSPSRRSPYSSPHRSPRRSSLRTYRRPSPYPSRSPPSVRFSDSQPTSHRSRRDSYSPSRNRPSIHQVSADAEYDAAIECYQSVKEAKARPSYTSPEHQPMFMIVPACARNMRTGSWDHVAILMDSGAQTSFITSATVSRLSLTPHGTRMLTTVSFGGFKETKGTPIVNVKLFDHTDQPFTATLYVKDVVAAPRQAQQLHPEDLSALNARRIDPDSLLVTQTVEPDILLGINYYWKVMFDDPPVVLPSGLVLSHTRSGPTVSGLSFFRQCGAAH
ncbi:hypothetical protein Y032_0028g1698 [Ancylostoma ceylanicum]|uniref:Uncharacterized protein n=1 Tax=Ancylostoma ceylanicum TaxID=53326 RepID=A0A016UTL5_9BILA|nr:hypothetical protein Y032_0028g1698 [Ancylostoma ceylanicum]